MFPNFSAAQFVSQPLFTAELQLRYETGQYYVHSQQQILPSYGAALAYGVLFYEGRPPFDYKTGLFWQSDDIADVRMLNEFRLFTERTLGRLILDSTVNARPVVPEIFAGISARRLLADDWLAMEGVIKKDLAVKSRFQQVPGVFPTHGGWRIEGGLRIRYLTLKGAKFYYAYHAHYADKKYLEAWFGSSEVGLPNVAMKAGIFETTQELLFVRNLGKKHLFEVNFYRGNLNGTASQSIILRNSEDRGIKVIYRYRF